MPALHAGYLMDGRTRTSLPFKPRPKLPLRVEGVPNIDRLADDHHPAEGAERLVKGTLSDRALRYSRCQWGLYDDHHLGWHKNGLSIVLPMGTRERFLYIGLMAALYLPDKCVAFNQTEFGLKPTIERLSMNMRNHMWERGDVRVEKDLIVNRFLAATAIELGMPALHTGFDENLRANFERDPTRYTDSFMHRLVELSTNVTGLDIDYAGAQQAGMIPASAPRTAKIFLVERIQDYADAYAGKPVESQESVTTMIQRVMSLELSQAS